MLESDLKENTTTLLEALLQGDVKAANAAVDAYIFEYPGNGIQSFYVDLVSELQQEISVLSAEGKITVSQRHRMTQIILDNLARVKQSARLRGALGVRAVVVALPGDQHHLSARVGCDLLMMDGWNVDLLSADMGIEDIVSYCKEVSTDLLGIFLVDSSSVERAQSIVEKVKAAMPNVKTIIGGIGAMKNEDIKRIESDSTIVEGAKTAVEARRVVGVGGTSNSLYQILGEIGSRIHHFRKSQKMSQEKLAQGSGLDRAYISSVENGKQNITIGALLKLSDALGVELSDLIIAPIHQSN